MSRVDCLTVLEHRPLAGTIHQRHSVRGFVPGDEGTRNLKTIVAHIFDSLGRRFPDYETDIELSRQTYLVG